MKLTSTLAAAFALLIACQVPVPSQLPPTTKPGTGSLKVTITTNGFQFIPQGVSASGARGREVIAPSGQAGIALLTLSNGPAPDITGDSTLGLSDVPPGTWDLTVELRNLLDTATLGTATVAGISVLPGPNSYPITITPTQSGFGGINVQYQWPATAGIDDATFYLYHWEGSWVQVDNPEPAIVPDFDNRKVDYTITNLTSSQYKLVLLLKSGSLAHPPVSSTVNVYDNVVSDHYATPIVLEAHRLNGPPAAPAVVTVTTANSRPYVDWSMEPTTATDYAVIRNGISVSSGPSSTHSYFDNDAEPGGVYEYRVVLHNDFGFSPSTYGSQLFRSVSAVSVSGPPQIGVGQPIVMNKTVLPDYPDPATISSVTWSSDFPQRASVQSDGTGRALAVGPVMIRGTSDEVPMSPYSPAFGEQAVTVEALVSTFAGIPYAPGSSDGALGMAQLQSTMGVAVGASGAFPGDTRVYSFDNVSGVPRLRITDMLAATSTPTLFDNATPPNSVTLPAGTILAATADNSGNLYFVLGCAIYRFQLGTGELTLLAGSVAGQGDQGGTGASALFRYPRGLALVGGYLYVSDSGNNVIKMVNAVDGTTSTYAGDRSPSNSDGPLINASVWDPRGIVYDGIDSLYVTSYSGGVIRKISMSGSTWSTLSGVLDEPNGLAIDGNYLYATDGYKVRRITLPGPDNSIALVSTIAGSYTLGYLDDLGSIARFGLLSTLAAAGGVVYVADPNSHTVRKINTSAYDTIYYDDARFDYADAEPVVMHYDGHYSGHVINTGDGSTGAIRVGTILLFTTSDGNHGKLLVTGIDRDVGGVTGRWRVWLDYTTWNTGGTIISQGSGVPYVGADQTAAPAIYTYFDLDTGTTVGTSLTGDMAIYGMDDMSRRFDPADLSLRVGFYQ